jgi:hypothetical protein
VVDKRERAIIPLELRIEFSDRFRLGPSFVIPKLLDDKVAFTIFATGASIHSVGPPMLVLKGRDGVASTEVRLNSSKTRNESLILTGSLEKEEFARAIEILGSENACLELSLGSMSNLTKVKMDMPENRP